MIALAARLRVIRMWHLWLIPIFGTAFFLIARVAVSPVEYANSDFFSFWLAGRFALTGQNPYSAALWIGGHTQFGATWLSDATFIYPLPLSLFFIPLGWLPLYPAFVMWAVLSQFMIVASVGLLLRSHPCSLAKPFLLPLLAGILLFRPTIITLHNGQLSAAFLLIIASFAHLWERGKWWQGSVLLPLLALKPNLGVPIILLLSLYLLLQRQWVPLLGAAAVGLVLFLAGLLQNPRWILEYWAVGHSKLAETFGYSATVWGLAAYMCKHNLGCTLAYGTVGNLLVLIGCVLLLAKRRYALSPTWAASFAVALTLLITPYTWPYDQLLLVVPIITVMMELAHRGAPFLPTALIFLGLDIAALLLLGVTARIQSEVWNALIPLSVLSLLVWMIWQKTDASVASLRHANAESD